MTLDIARRRILDNDSLTFYAAEFLGLIGPNGGGKTMLLWLMLGRVRPTLGPPAGRVL